MIYKYNTLINNTYNPRINFYDYLFIYYKEIAT